MEGEGLGDLVACDDVRRQTIDTLGAVPYCNNFHFASTCPWWNNEQYCSCLANALASIPWMNITKVLQILHWTLPPCVYLPTSWRQDWWWWRPGNEVCHKVCQWIGSWQIDTLEITNKVKKLVFDIWPFCQRLQREGGTLPVKVTNLIFLCACGGHVNPLKYGESLGIRLLPYHSCMHACQSLTDVSISPAHVILSVQGAHLSRPWHLRGALVYDVCWSVERHYWESAVVVWATAIVTGCRVCVGILPEDKRKNWGRREAIALTLVPIIWQIIIEVSAMELDSQAF